ncbi:uncharacterized protein LOC144135398 [Amblyomma americanum]
MKIRCCCTSLLLVAAFAFTAAAPTDDECDIHKLDECAADLFVFTSRDSVPESEDDLGAFCKAQEEAEACSRAYLKKCTSSVAQGVGTVFLDDIREEIQERCDTSTDYHKDYIKHAPCLNKVGSQFNACIKATTSDLDVASRLPAKQRIGGACCQYSKLEVCVAQAVEPACPPETAEFAKSVLQRYAGELLGTVCVGFRSGEKCKGIEYDDKPGDPTLRSIMTPLIKVGSALGG